MRRMFWLTVGVAAGYYAARRGEQALEQARTRGVVGNVTLAATTLSTVATSATKAALAVGEAAGSRSRRVTKGDAAEGSAAAGSATEGSAAGRSASPTSAPRRDLTTREARP